MRYGSAASFAELQNYANPSLQEFEIADNHLRETLPPIIQATFSLIPPLLAAHVLVQNRLLGLYYTVLHGYCEDYGFPSPAPPMEDVIQAWSDAFQPAKRDVESISMIARGRGIREPLALENDGPGNRKLSAPPAGFDGMHRTSSGLIPSSNGGRQRVPSYQSSTSPIPSPQPSPVIGPRPDVKNSNYGGHLRPTDFTTASDLGKSPGSVSPSQLRQTSAGDYFGGRVPPSPASTVASNYSQNSNGHAVAAKKKPPPPPPKRIASGKLEEYVVAQYDFAGQGAGDLSFREGDRIKIIKKTRTDQDWWTGEIGGKRGSFPANYCKPA